MPPKYPIFCNPFILTFIFLLTFVFAPATLQADERKIIGTWKGWYTCSQGKTGLTLEFIENEEGGVISLFSFYGLKGQNRVPDGSFAGRITIVSGDSFESSPLSWINQPPNFSMVGFDGNMDASGQSISGNIHFQGCSDLYVERTNEPLSEIALNIARQNLGPPKFAYSSFEGLNLDINGIRLDLPITESLIKFNPKFHIKQGKWSDSQGQSKRSQPGLQNYAAGNIWGIRESTSITPVDWHSGEYIRRINRELTIKPDDQKPTIKGFRQAVIDKYGPPTHSDDYRPTIGFLSGYSEDYLIYTVKDKQIKQAQCWDAGYSPFNPRTTTDERIAFYKDMLVQIDNGWCEAVLVHFYTKDNRNKDRIRRYGSRARDFRLEAEAYLEDVKQKIAATERRQKLTPEGKTKL